MNGLQSNHKDGNAKIYGVSPQTVLGRGSTGKFLKRLPGRNYLWPVRAIEQFIGQFNGTVIPARGRSEEGENTGSV